MALGTATTAVLALARVISFRRHKYQMTWQRCASANVCARAFQTASRVLLFDGRESSVRSLIPEATVYAVRASSDERLRTRDFRSADERTDRMIRIRVIRRVNSTHQTAMSCTPSKHPSRFYATTYAGVTVYLYPPPQFYPGRV